MQGLLLQSDECLGVGLELTYHSLGCSNRMISVEDFHRFVVKDAYLVRQDNNLCEPFYARFSRSLFLMTLKASPKSLARTKSLFVFASDFWYSSMIFC